MTHRIEVFSIKSTTTLKEALPLAVDSGFSRIPIYEGTPEQIIGILLVRDLVQEIIDKHEELTVDQICMDPIFVSETRNIHEMFLIFKQHKLHLATVLDEYGGLAGIVTLEDVIEELFGELYDEHESGSAERISIVTDGVYSIMGETSIKQVEDFFDLDMKHSRHVGTISGYITEQLGTIPEEHQVLDTEWGIFKITSMTGNKINTITFMPLSHTEP